MSVLANRNATRHGLRAGQLPKGASYVKRSTDELRRIIEDAVLAASKEITIRDAATIQSAIRWERHALLAQRWLRLECAELSPDQRLAFSREVARASSERDKCLAALQLDKGSQSVFDALYGPSNGEPDEAFAHAKTSATTEATPEPASGEHEPDAF